MMGLGYLGGGGPSSSSSSSSSNLSALAPPFTVDRSNSKTSSNPLLQFSESPYATGFGLGWQYSNSAIPGPNLYKSSEPNVDSTNITSMPTTNDYSFRFSVPQSNAPQSSNWSSLSPNTENTTRSSLYDHKVEPYYPPYVSPGVNEPIYDMLPPSAMFSADVSSQVDYTQILSALGCTPQWPDVWNGLTDAKRDKQAEIGGSFSLAEANSGDTAAYRNHANQGLVMAEFGDTLEDSGISCREFCPAVGRECSNGLVSMERTESTSLLPPKVFSVPFDSSRTKITSSDFTIPEAIHLGLPIQSTKKFMSYQTPYNIYDKCSHPAGSCASSSVSMTKSSSALVIRPPPVNTGSAPQRTPSGKTVDILDVSSVHKNDQLGCDGPSIGKETYAVLNSKSEEGYCITRQFKSHKDVDDDMLSLTFSVVEEPSSKLQSKDFLNHGLESMSLSGGSQTKGLRMKSGSQIPTINVSDGSLFSGDNVQHIKSSENFSDCLDHHNPVVDSPCWKGAPASHVSLFDVGESETTPQILNKSEDYHPVDFRVDLIFSPLSDPIRSPSKKADQEKGQHEFESTAGDQRFSSPARATINNPILTSRKVVPGYEESSEPGENNCQLNHSKIDSRSVFFGTKQLHDEEDNITSTQPNLPAAVLDTGLSINDTTEAGDVAVRAAENVLCSSSSEGSAREQSKPCGIESTPKMDVQTLISAMQNLSELLLLNCSSDSCTLKEQDHESIKLVMNNLGAVVSGKLVFVTQSQDPQEHISGKVGEYMDPHMSFAAGNPQLVNGASAKSGGRLDYLERLEDRRNDNGYGYRPESFEQYCLSRHGLDVLRDDNMSQAIREILNENFQYREEMHSEALLFKKLWLEAEAKLCSISYRARFDRMKVEMEKLKSNQAKTNAAVTGKSSSSNISHDSNPSILESPNAETGSVPKTTIPSSSNYIDDVEASVMNRLHVLKCHDVPTVLNLVEQLAANDVDSSVLSRPNILKCRNDLKAPNFGQQQAADDIDSPVETRQHIFEGQTNPKPNNAVGQEATDWVESSVMTRHPILECCKDGRPMNPAGKRTDTIDTNYIGKMFNIGGQEADFGGTGYESVRDFLLSATGDSGTQSFGSSGQRNQYSIGSNDNFSSDWEHVLKDDVSWR